MAAWIKRFRCSIFIPFKGSQRLCFNLYFEQFHRSINYKWLHLIVWCVIKENYKEINWMFEAPQGTQYWGSKDLLLPNGDQERFSGKSQALNEVTGCINPITSFVTLRNIVAIVIFTYQLILHNTSMIVLWNYCESIVARVYFPLSTNKALSWKGLLYLLHEGNKARGNSATKRNFYSILSVEAICRYILVLTIENVGEDNKEHLCAII